jgi:hypothetical protein
MKQQLLGATVWLWQERGLLPGHEGAFAKGVYAFEIEVSQDVGFCPKRGIWDQRPPTKDMRERREMLVGLDAMIASS